MHNIGIVQFFRAVRDSNNASSLFNYPTDIRWVLVPVDNNDLFWLLEKEDGISIRGTAFYSLMAPSRRFFANAKEWWTQLNDTG